MCKKDEFLKAIKKLKDLNLKELDFLKNELLDEKTIFEFQEKKLKFRKLIDSHLKALEFDENEKTQIKNSFIELVDLEEKIGVSYKEKLNNIQDGLIHINTERKLRETYGKGGMSFLMDEDKNLK